MQQNKVSMEESSDISELDNKGWWTSLQIAHKKLFLLMLSFWDQRAPTFPQKNITCIDIFVEEMTEKAFYLFIFVTCSHVLL